MLKTILTEEKDSVYDLSIGCIGKIRHTFFDLTETAKMTVPIFCYKTHYCKSSPAVL